MSLLNVFVCLLEKLHSGAAGATKSLGYDEYDNLSSFLGIFLGTKLWQYMSPRDIGLG